MESCRKSFPIVVGRSKESVPASHNVHIDRDAEDQLPLKHEGDGRSPAGFIP